MNAREKDAHLDLCRRLATALAERDAARAVGADELRIAALTHAIECYDGPDDDTLPVLRHWLAALTEAAPK